MFVLLFRVKPGQIDHLTGERQAGSSIPRPRVEDRLRSSAEVSSPQRSGRYIRDPSSALALAEPLVVGEEERLILPDRPSYRPAELVLHEIRQPPCATRKVFIIEVVACVQSR